MDQDERDLLIRVDENIQHLVSTFKDHLQSDKEQFKDHNDSIKFLQKMVFLGIGGLTVITFILKFIK